MIAAFAFRGDRVKPDLNRSGRVAAPVRLVLAAMLAMATATAFAQQAPAGPADAAVRPAVPAQPASLPTPSTLVQTPANAASDAVAATDDTQAPDADEPAEASGQSRIRTLIQRALALLGTPYRWGGMSPDKGFDCSGLVGYVFRNALGIELPRVSRDMAQTGERIQDRSELNAGDLVFFGRRGRVDHVGIYLGNGRFVHAPSRGKDVTVSSLDSGYWSHKFLLARRIDGV